MHNKKLACLLASVYPPPKREYECFRWRHRHYLLDHGACINGTGVMSLWVVCLLPFIATLHKGRLAHLCSLADFVRIGYGLKKRSRTVQ